MAKQPLQALELGRRWLGIAAFPKVDCYGINCQHLGKLPLGEAKQAASMGDLGREGLRHRDRIVAQEFDDFGELPDGFISAPVPIPDGLNMGSEPVG